MDIEDKNDQSTVKILYMSCGSVVEIPQRIYYIRSAHMYNIDQTDAFHCSTEVPQHRRVKNYETLSAHNGFSVHDMNLS